MEDAQSVRFTHQLLQEYFSARRLLTEIDKGLNPQIFWSPKLWWQSNGWEEAVVLAAGMSEHAALKVLDWVLPANAETAAACILRSGMDFNDDTKITLRSHWLPQLTNLKTQPEPAARSAIDRALGRIYLSNGESLDNRPGVGLRGDDIPDIEWVPITGGTVVLENNAGKHTVGNFHIARYPITYIQFQAFIDDNGYDDQKWWQNLLRQEPQTPVGTRQMRLGKQFPGLKP